MGHLLSSDLKYWLTPPEILAQLHAEFKFTCDPCPYPLPHEGHSSLDLPWGKSNFVNPPFYAMDNTDGLGIISFAKKAVDEHKQGNQSVLILPSTDYANYLVEAGAEVRSMGRVGWISTITGKSSSSAATALYILRGERNLRDEQRQHVVTLLLEAHKPPYGVLAVLQQAKLTGASFSGIF
jgi:hypothetical protein